MKKPAEYRDEFGVLWASREAYDEYMRIAKKEAVAKYREDYARASGFAQYMRPKEQD